MGLRVVNSDFTPIGWGASIVRNLLRAADFFPAFYATGLISMTLTAHFQRLGDLAAGSLVIYQEVDRPVSVDPDIKAVMPPVPLTRDERQGIVDLTLRSRSISDSRQQELADLLSPVTGESGSAGLGKLKGIGVWLLGGNR